VFGIPEVWVPATVPEIESKVSEELYVGLIYVDYKRGKKGVVYGEQEACYL